MKKGFTLIELLVVVLIIGILAAIALPQYQKAVERSRMAQAVQTLGDWAQAQSIYYMQHNEFAENINDGDITLPEPGDSFYYDVDGDVDWAELMAQRNAGIYEGGRLLIGVESNGTIYKLCDGPEGFCSQAESSGYIPQEISWWSDKDPAGGGSGTGTAVDGSVTGIADKVCPMPRPECAHGYDEVKCTCKMTDVGGGLTLACLSGYELVDGECVRKETGGGGGFSGSTSPFIDELPSTKRCKLLGTC